MKIYDCFLFFNELDLLEIRLNVLNEFVDYFVLVEANVTHQGAKKSFIFDENKDRFSKFLHKIRHIKLTDVPENFYNKKISYHNDYELNVISDIWHYIEETNAFNRYTEPHYGRIFYQRECIKLGLYDCTDNDIIISSDVDEIPNPEYLSRLTEFFNDNLLYTFIQSKYCYYLNILFNSTNDNTRYNNIKNTKWNGSRMGSYKILKKYSFNKLRNEVNNNIIDGGWHFSYVGGTNIINEKIMASDGSGYSNEAYINQENLIKVELDESYPNYIIKNLDKYKHLIYDFN